MDFGMIIMIFVLLVSSYKAYVAIKEYNFDPINKVFESIIIIFLASLPYLIPLLIGMSKN